MGTLRGWAVASVVGVLVLMLVTRILVIDMVQGKASLEPLGYIIFGALTLAALAALWLITRARSEGFRGATSELLRTLAVGELGVLLIGWIVYYRKWR
jgi:hypothetical protein